MLPCPENATREKKRLSLIADRLQEAILEDVLLIDTQGKVVGQINGLAVYDPETIVWSALALLLALTGNKGSQHRARISPWPHP